MNPPLTPEECRVVLEKAATAQQDVRRKEQMTIGKTLGYPDQAEKAIHLLDHNSVLQ